jgi:hypothetical protein
MTGTSNQIELAEQIKANVAIEFDRVANALETAARYQNQTELDRTCTRAMIDILEEKRVEVLANDKAGYFIMEWHEMKDQVRQLIARDPRYRAIKASKTAQIPT